MKALTLHRPWSDAIAGFEYCPRNWCFVGDMARVAELLREATGEVE